MSHTKDFLMFAANRLGHNDCDLNSRVIDDINEHHSELIQAYVKHINEERINNLCPVCNRNPIEPNRDGTCVDCSH